MRRFLPPTLMPTDSGNDKQPEMPQGKAEHAQGQISPRKRMAMKNGQRKVSISSTSK